MDPHSARKEVGNHLQQIEGILHGDTPCLRNRLLLLLSYHRFGVTRHCMSRLSLRQPNWSILTDVSARYVYLCQPGTAFTSSLCIMRNQTRALVSVCSVTMEQHRTWDTTSQSRMCIVNAYFREYRPTDLQVRPTRLLYYP
jgi:hypothetical protein